MNILITGGSSGIGLALVKYYRERGEQVINLSLDQADYNCDVTDRARLEEIFADIKNKYNHIDILINCAGLGITGAIETVPIEKVKKIYDVNVIGTVNTIQLCLPIMSERGKIINISSVAGFFPTPFRSFYGSSKASVSMLTDSLRMELARTKIQVTAICPSEIQTNFSKNRIKSLETNQRYGNSVAYALKRIEDRDSKRMPLEKASKIIIKWINKKHLKPQYIMGFKFKFLYHTFRLIPKSLYLKVCNHVFNKMK